MMSESSDAQVSRRRYANEEEADAQLAPHTHSFPTLCLLGSVSQSLGPRWRLGERVDRDGQCCQWEDVFI